MLSRFKKMEAKHLKDTKRLRGFWCVSSGMEKAAKLGIPLYRLDLTLREYEQPRTYSYLQALRKRILRHYHISIVYASIKAQGDKGGRVHLHLVYWVQTLNKKPVFDLSKAWINKRWLSWNWQDITGSKITYIQTVKGGLTSRKKVSGYFIGQYFSGQNNYERMSYSRAWMFVGASTLWKSYFSPNYFGDQKQSTLDSWVNLLAHPTDLALPAG